MVERRAIFDKALAAAALDRSRSYGRRSSRWPFDARVDPAIEECDDYVAVTIGAATNSMSLHDG